MPNYGDYVSRPKCASGESHQVNQDKRTLDSAILKRQRRRGHSPQSVFRWGSFSAWGSIHYLGFHPGVPPGRRALAGTSSWL